MALVLLSAFALSITGCGGKADRIAPGRSPSACIGGEADKIEISHFTGGAETRWTVEGEKAEALRNWAGGLKYEILEAPEGQSPGDADGGEVYDFILPEGVALGFPTLPRQQLLPADGGLLVYCNEPVRSPMHGSLKGLRSIPRARVYPPLAGMGSVFRLQTESLRPGLSSPAGIV